MIEITPFPNLTVGVEKTVSAETLTASCAHGIISLGDAPFAPERDVSWLGVHLLLLTK